MRASADDIGIWGPTPRLFIDLFVHILSARIVPQKNTPASCEAASRCFLPSQSWPTGSPGHLLCNFIQTLRHLSRSDMRQNRFRETSIAILCHSNARLAEIGGFRLACRRTDQNAKKTTRLSGRASICETIGQPEIEPPRESSDSRSKKSQSTFTSPCVQISWSRS